MEKLLELEFADLRERVYPLMMDPFQIQEKGQGQMVNGALAEGLVTIYALEESNDKIRYITYQDLRDWNVSHSVLHVIAVKNLERRTQGKRITKLDSEHGDRPMFIWHLEDGFDAARMLLPTFIDDVAAAVSGRLLIAAPHRNLLIALGDSDPNVVRVVRRRVSSEHHSADFPVSPFVYLWTGERLERYTEGGPE